MQSLIAMQKSVVVGKFYLFTEQLISMKRYINHFGYLKYLYKKIEFLSLFLKYIYIKALCIEIIFDSVSKPLNFSYYF